MVERLHRRCRDERGVVLVLVAILMVAFIGMGALAIDVGSFYQQQRQAQNAADAAALEGVHDTASTPTVTTDVNAYVAANMPGATSAITYPAAGQIKVVVSKTVPSFLGHIFGIASANVSATAVAAQTAGSTLCATPGNACYAVFAKDSNCSDVGLTLVGGGYTILGGINSNGSITTGNGGSTFGPTTYGTGCTESTGGGDTFTSGPTAQAPITTWPIDYSADFPGCGGALQAACNASGTPSYCSSSAASITFTNGSQPTSGYIYCAYGSGTLVKKSDPTTWNGTITFLDGGYAGSASSPVPASFVAGNVYINSGTTFFKACGYAAAGYDASQCQGASGQTMPAPATSNKNYPVIYAVDTDAQAGTTDQYAVNLGGGSNTWMGDVFAPNGSAVVKAGSQNIGFIEANDVEYKSGGITGDGPSDSGTGSSSSGSVSLVG